MLLEVYLHSVIYHNTSPVLEYAGRNELASSGVIL